MVSTTITDTAVRFHAAINARDPDALADAMADDHRFVDAAEAVVEGRPACLEAWKGFFASFPDYRNEVDHIEEIDGVAVMRGRSHCAEPALDGPALWRAIVAGGAVTEWHVYDDTPETRRALGLDAGVT